MRLGTIRAAGILALAVSLLWCSSTASALPANGVPSPERLAAPPLLAVVLYEQPPSPSGGLLPSSLRDPDGSDLDRWAWDSFVVGQNAALTELHWSGGYDPVMGGMGGPVTDFTVALYASSTLVNEPDLSAPLVKYELRTNAGETPGQVLGGVQMYDYAFTLPTLFVATSGTKYWVQIEAFQSGAAPDWGLTKGTGGNGTYFRRVVGEQNVYQTVAGDASFAVLGQRAADKLIYLPSILR